MTTITIEAKPDWQATAKMLAVLLENATTVEGKRVAHEELARMARLADGFVAVSQAFAEPHYGDKDAQLDHVYEALQKYGGA